MNRKGIGPDAGLSGRIGGLAVKHMIQDMERRMAAGEQVDAGPANQSEAEVLAQVKDANDQSANSARKRAPR